MSVSITVVVLSLILLVECFLCVWHYTMNFYLTLVSQKSFEIGILCLLITKKI